LPAEAADEWFNPALAQQAAELTHALIDVQADALAALAPPSETRRAKATP
jgi:hypothetical protein